MRTTIQKPTIADLIKKENFSYAKKQVDLSEKWGNRETKEYEVVEADTALTDDVECKVETSFSAGVETAAEVASNVTVEVDSNYDVSSEYSQTTFSEPVVGKSVSSPLLTITQLVNRIAKTNIDPHSSQYKVESDSYSYAESFAAVKALVMPNPDSHTLSHQNNALGNVSIYLRDLEAVRSVQNAMESINSITSFNKDLYVRSGSITEQQVESECTTKPDLSGDWKMQLSSNLTKQFQKHVLYVSTSSNLDKFHVPCIPVITESAMKALEHNKWLYDAGFENAILPLGFFIVPVKIKTTTQSNAPHSSQLKVVNKTGYITHTHYVLDFSEDLYQIQKASHRKSLESYEQNNAAIQALFTIDHLEFAKQESQKSEYSDYIKTALSKDYLDQSHEDTNVDLFLHYCLFIQKHNPQLYQSIKQSLLNSDISSSHFTSQEIIGYLKEFATIAILTTIDPSHDKDLELQVPLATAKATFIQATFNSMNKSNFIQTSRALKAFLFKFDEMTNFQDPQTKIKFYNLLAERTVHNGKLCLKGIKGVAQVELFRLFKILDIAASKGAQLLELQLQLLRERAPDSDVLKDESDISIGAYGDTRSYSLVASESAEFNDTGLALLDGSMCLAQQECDLKKAVQLSHPSDKDIGVLGLLSKRLYSDATLFGTSKIENKIAIYSIIKSLALRIDYLVDTKKVSENLRTSFNTLGKLYIENSISIEHSALYDFVVWAEKILTQKSNLPYDIKIPMLSSLNSTIRDEIKFQRVFYQAYSGKTITLNRYNTIPNLTRLNDLSTAAYRLSNHHKIKGKEASTPHLFQNIVVDPSAGCILVHNKNQTAEHYITQPLELAENDLLRYQALWCLQRSHRDLIIQAGYKQSSDTKLTELFSNIKASLEAVFKADDTLAFAKQNLESPYNSYFNPVVGAKNLNADSNVQHVACDTLESYKSAIIDSRFLVIHALCHNAPSDLTPENDIGEKITWVNKWLESCNLSVNVSEFEPIAYGLMKKILNGASNYHQFVDAISGEFPKIVHNVGRDFSFFNILKAPNPVQISSSTKFQDASEHYIDETAYEPLEFFNKLDSLIKEHGLEAQKGSIFSNALYKLFDYKLSRAQISRFKDGALHIIDFKDQKKREEYTQILFKSYFSDDAERIASLDSKTLFDEVETYVQSAAPILHDFNCNIETLSFYKPFFNPYGIHFNDLFEKIKSYDAILKSASIERFQDDSTRETSSENFYHILKETIECWSPNEEESSAQYFKSFHRYLDMVLESGVSSQTRYGHNFSSIMYTALGLLTQREAPVFSENSQSAATVFTRLDQICTRRADTLIFDYFAHFTKANLTDCFQLLAKQLEHSSNELEELIYNINAIDSTLYGLRFQLFESIVTKSNPEKLSNNIAVINCVLTNLYGKDKREQIITSKEDLTLLIASLNSLTEEQAHLLKRYLVPPASNHYSKEQLLELFTKDGFNADACKQRLEALRATALYKFDKEKVRLKFSKIVGPKDLDSLVSDCETIFNNCTQIASLNDADFKSNFSKLDKANQSNDLMILAYIVDTINRFTGVEIRPIQLAPVLLTIKRNQSCFHILKTGQGKTFVLMIIAAFYNIKKWRATFATTTIELAAIAAKTFFPILEFLGIKSNINPVTPKGTELEIFNKSEINFSTVGDVANFKNMVRQSGKALSEGRSEIFLVDEFDSVRDDTSVYRLSSHLEFEGVENTPHCLRLMLRHMVEFVDNTKIQEKNVFNYGQKTPDDEKQDHENFKLFISKIGIELFNEYDKEQVKNSQKALELLAALQDITQVENMVTQMSSDSIVFLLNACNLSKHAFENWKKGREYDELPSYKLQRNPGKQDSIKLINTILPIINGQLNNNSWNSKLSGAQQQFLAIRKNKALGNDSSLKYDEETLTYASAISAPDTLLHSGSDEEYQLVIGVSGTAGNASQKSRTLDTLGMDVIFYPEHEEMDKKGLFEGKTFEFLQGTSKGRLDDYVLLTKTDDEKIDALARIIAETSKDGETTDPFLILCNNHEDVYRYQALLQNKIQDYTKAAIVIQTAGLGSMKSLDTTTNKMRCLDQENYLAGRQARGLPGEGDRRRSLSDRIMEDASRRNTVTFATLGNHARGIDIKKQIGDPESLHSVTFGCNKAVSTPSIVRQGYGRAVGRFKDGTAGTIISVKELKQELSKLGIDIEDEHIIVDHFYSLLDLVVDCNTINSEKSRVFNIVWSVVQKTIQGEITLENKDESVRLLINLRQAFEKAWSEATQENKGQKAFSKKASELFSQYSKDQDLTNKLNANIIAAYATYNFPELKSEKPTFLRPITKTFTMPQFRWLIDQYDSGVFRLLTVVAPIALCKVVCSLICSQSKLPMALAPLISGALYGFLFQYSLNNKVDLLKSWNYENSLTSYATGSGATAGFGFAIQYQLLYMFMNLGSTLLANKDLLSISNCTLSTIIAGFTTAQYIYPKLQEYTLDTLDSNAMYVRPARIEM